MNGSVSYILFEGEMTRMERVIKRLWILAIILIVLLVGTNVAWLAYESQYQDVVTSTQTITQDGDSNSYSGNFVGGDYNGKTND